MFKREQEQYGELGADYWWLGGKYDIVADLMRRHCAPVRGKREILDVGCGPGNLIGHLSAFGVVTGSDFSDDAVRLAHGKEYREVVHSKAEELPFENACFDTVVALDIIEHTPDDVATIKEIARVLKPGGEIVFSLPAYMCLWGPHDEIYGHYRRYTRGEIVRKLEAGGFEIAQATYIEPAFLPLLFIIRRLKRLSTRPQDDFVALPRWLNTVLRHVIAAERHVTRIGDIPFGVSILGVARKHDSRDSRD
jgi:SAM-dependent methyltransferase